MAITPARTAKLPTACDLGISWGDTVFLSASMPDVSWALDLRAWPMPARSIPGFFASSVARTRSGRVVAVARHHHANPYKLYELDLEAVRVKGLPLNAPWTSLTSVFAVGDRVMVVPSVDLKDPSRRPSWWAEDGAVEPLELTLPEAPAVIEWGGRRYAPPRPMDRVDVIPLPDDEALVIWFERLHRAGRDGVTPLALDRLFASWESLREGRHGAIDDAGRALAVVHDRFLTLDRDGQHTEISPGSHPVRSAAPGPDATWFLLCDETVHWVFPKEREVIALDLKGMRLSPTMPLFTPKPVWVSARDALLVMHAHDAHEYDLAALRKEKRVPFEKLTAKLASTRRSAWNRKVKDAGPSPMALDALSPHTRGGVVVQHPEYGVGFVKHASEVLHAGTQTITATVLFEHRAREFYFAGDRWIERSWTFG